MGELCRWSWDLGSGRLELAAFEVELPMLCKLGLAARGLGRQHKDVGRRRNLERSRTGPEGG